MLRHVSKQIAIQQRGQKYTFSERFLRAVSKKFQLGSIGIPSKILASPLGKIVAREQSSLKMYLLLHLL